MSDAGPRLLFAHGLESGPVGKKSEALRAAGFALVAPDCRGLELAARIDVLRAAIVAEREPPLLVGSSFGGLAALRAAALAARDGHAVRALLLCAPALGLAPAEWAAELGPPARTELVHGLRDAVVPIGDSRRYAAAYGATLFEVDDDHRLNERGLAVILERAAVLLCQTEGRDMR